MQLLQGKASIMTRFYSNKKASELIEEHRCSIFFSHQSNISLTNGYSVEGGGLIMAMHFSAWWIKFKYIHYFPVSERRAAPSASRAAKVGS